MASRLPILEQHQRPSHVTRTQAEQLAVALVSMPFVSIDAPSIQLGLLKALANAEHFPVTNLSLSLDFARQIGLERYGVLANHRGRLYGDWLFAAAADRPRGDFLRDFGGEINQRLRDLGSCPVQILRTIRNEEVPRYLERLLDTIPWAKFRVVGFTSTFQQNMASLALAARIKKRHPAVCILFGGANFDGEMGAEMVRAFDCIDYAIDGPGDEAFVEFLAAIAHDRDPTTVPGVRSRNRPTPVARPASKALDRLPIPDYDEFFERAYSLGILSKSSRSQVRIPFESSRGCWWGQKQHCTFCGLNGTTMAFREKTATRLIDELAQLAQRHRTFQFEAVDNIMPMSYLQELLPKLVAQGTTYTLFYETKANLRRDQIALLATAGVRTIQPGIESLNTRVLKLMRKGVTAIQNVNLLRWASYYDIRVVWNILWGFPEETVEDYAQQSLLLPQLHHLQSPLSASRIWMERFSPIYFDRSRFPVKRLAPEKSYQYVYPDRVDCAKVAYFFDYEFENSLPDSSYEQIAHAAAMWQESRHRVPRPRLIYRSSPGFVQIEDQRACGELSTYTLTGQLATLYAACSDSPMGVSKLLRNNEMSWSESKCEGALNELCRQGLMMRDGELFLSLAVPTRVESLSPEQQR